ncbi:hypothetical protein ACH5RR_006737 [Cinchona calisaya]|uniref:3-phosphoinositide-dependent protein kinase-1 n=1 Tax=Cinchona calisaya TaxID=153742 RepID=A0ABD3APX1_9GENT
MQSLPSSVASVAQCGNSIACLTQSSSWLVDSSASNHISAIKREMAVFSAKTATWEEIERSESYLVSCMFEEAAALAFSIIGNLLENCQTGGFENYSMNERDDMLESAGMVLAQSMKELARTSEILNELKLLFGSVTAIPVQVFITGACFQISEVPSSGVERYLEEFLGKWLYKDEGYYLSVEETADREGFGKQFAIGVNQYLEVVDLYVTTCLGMVLRDIDSAISWVEKAALPEEKRQELLRRLLLMNASKAAISSSQAVVSSLLVDKHGTESAFLEEQKTYNKSSKNLESGYLANRETSVEETILKLSGQGAPCFWWFRTITLKFGNAKLVLSNGNIFLGCLLLVACYFVRRKQASLKGVLKKQVMSMKKALVDLWQLAFSYQVNPLAAVQPLPTTTRGSR